MFNINVPKGAIYYHSSHHRLEIEIDNKLKLQTIECINNIRSLYTEKNLPQPVNDKRCNECSIFNICQPTILHSIKNHALDSWQKLFSIEDDK